MLASLTIARQMIRHPPRKSAANSPPHWDISTAVSRLRVRHLQTIDALARLGSLRQVALELGLTQPATL